MPLYDYRCTECGREVEVRHGIHGTGPEICETCGGVMRKALSSPAVHFKGSGWAKKDAAAASARKAKPKASGSSSAASASSETGSEASTSGPGETGKTESTSTTAGDKPDSSKSTKSTKSD